MFNIPAWWCCINPAERQILRLCAESFVLSASLGIPCDAYDLFWIPVLRSRNARKNAFLSIYGLTLSEAVFPPAEEPVCAYTFDNDAFWFALIAHILTPEGACLDGCERWRPL